MGGWTVVRLEQGGYLVLHLDGDTGEETRVGEFEPPVLVDRVIEEILLRAEVGDWIIGPSDYGVRVVGMAAEEP